MTRTFHLRELSEVFAISKLSPKEPIPRWAMSGKIWSVTRTPSELSIICPQTKVPQSLEAERNLRALQVLDTLTFEMVGVLSSLTVPLANEGISIFALSTFDTDLILVRARSFKAACQTLTNAGHNIDTQ